MKKQFLNLGKALNKAEQKQIFGGEIPPEGLYGPCAITCGDGSTISGGPDCNVDIRNICAEDGNNGPVTETCNCIVA